jgi:hypothetical protein
MKQVIRCSFATGAAVSMLARAGIRARDLGGSRLEVDSRSVTQARRVLGVRTASSASAPRGVPRPPAGRGRPVARASAKNDPEPFKTEELTDEQFAELAELTGVSVERLRKMSREQICELLVEVDQKVISLTKGVEKQKKANRARATASAARKPSLAELDPEEKRRLDEAFNGKPVRVVNPIERQHGGRVEVTHACTPQEARKALAQMKGSK